MSIGTGNGWSIASFGLLIPQAVSVSIAHPSTSGKFNVYSVETTADGSPLSTLVHEDVPGQLDLDRTREVENGQYENILQYFILFPFRYLDTIEIGYQVTDSVNTYKVRYVEDFDDHQEVYLMKVNP